MSFYINTMRLVFFIALIHLTQFPIHAQQFAWGKTFEATDGIISAASGGGIAVGENDDIFVSGSFDGQMNINGVTLRSKQTDGFLIKLNAAGTVLWSLQMGASVAGYFSSVKIDSQGDIYVSGVFDGTLNLPDRTIVGSDHNNGIIAKYSKAGKLLWIKTYPNRLLGELVIDNNDNVYALGMDFNLIGPIAGGSNDTWLLKFDRNGNQILNHTIFRQTKDGGYVGIKLTLDPANNIFISGLASGSVHFGNVPFTSNTPYGAFTLLKCNQQGIPLWIKAIEDIPLSGVMYSGDIVCDGYGNVYYAVHGNKLSLAKLDSDGNTIWNLRNDNILLGIRKIILDPKGNLITIGSFQGQFKLGNFNFSGTGQSVFVGLFNSQGELQWGLQGTKEENNYLLAIDRSPLTGSLYVTGYIQSPASSFGNILLPNPKRTVQAAVLKITDPKFQPVTLNLGDNTTICPGETLELKAGDFIWYEWQDKSQAPTYQVKEPGEYHVTARDFTGRQYSDTIRVEECLEAIIPNTITPNGDALNEAFVIPQLNTSLNNSLKIFDRWGKNVYATSAYQNNWNGDGLSAGTYYYELKQESPAKVYRGWVEVIR